MRIIKFRGKDVFTDTWKYGDLVHNQRVTTTGLEPRTMVGGYEVDSETIGQFTGFLDKNGKEIYEGDVLLKAGGFLYDIINTPYEVYGIIGFEDYAARFVINDFYLTINGNKGTGNACGHSFTQDYMQDFEVVGSVHDNEWQEKLKLNNE